MRKLLIAALALALMAGCASVNTTFVYKPGAPAVGGPKLPVKVAVLPFKDGTEDFTTRGSIVFAETLTYNLAKAGITGIMPALTPELWAKAFADDMAASGAFLAVRFIYSPSELADEEFTIEGTVEKAYMPHFANQTAEFSLSLRALRRADKKLAWEKEVTRKRKSTDSRADTNMLMQGIFAEARADLVTTLAALTGSRSGESGLPTAASPGEARQEKGTSSSPAQESVEQTIERLLKEK